MEIVQPFINRRLSRLFGATALLLASAIIGCGPPGAAGEEKMRMDRLSIQRSNLQKELDDKNAKIIALQDELQSARQQIADLKAKAEAPKPQPTTTPTNAPSNALTNSPTTAP